MIVGYEFVLLSKLLLLSDFLLALLLLLLPVLLVVMVLLLMVLLISVLFCLLLVNSVVHQLLFNGSLKIHIGLFTQRKLEFNRSLTLVAYILKVYGHRVSGLVYLKN